MAVIYTQTMVKKLSMQKLVKKKFNIRKIQFYKIMRRKQEWLNRKGEIRNEKNSEIEKLISK